MRASEHVDPNEEIDRVGERLIDLYRDAIRGGHLARAVLKVIWPLVDALYPFDHAPQITVQGEKGEEQKRTKIPFMLKSLNADEVAELLGVEKRYFQERIAYMPGFPMQANPKDQRPRWIASEVIDWRIDVRPKIRRKSVRVRSRPSAPGSN